MRNAGQKKLWPCFIDKVHLPKVAEALRRGIIVLITRSQESWYSFYKQTSKWWKAESNMLPPSSLELRVLWLVNQIYFFIVTCSHDNNIDTYHARLDWICFSWYSKSAKTMLYKFRKSEGLEIQISQISQENTCVGVSFLRKLHTFWPATLLKRDSNTGAFCEIFKNTSFEEHLRTTTSKCWIIFPF